jgi:hypothetical protein
MVRPAQDGDRARRLLEHLREALHLGRCLPLGQHARRRLVALVEHARDRSVLGVDGRQAVIPIGLLYAAVPLYRQHLVEGGEALARLNDLLELRLQDLPDVRPHFASRAAERPGMPLRGNRRPSVVIEEAQLRPPIDRRRKARLETDAQDETERQRPCFRRTERCARPIVRAHARSQIAAPGEEIGTLHLSLTYRAPRRLNDERPPS